MFLRNWKNELFTIPNLLSLFRLVLIPVYMTIYLDTATPTGHYLAGSILALSCLTDLLDGAIARRYAMVTDLGKMLDPLADKATQLAVTFCLSIRYSILQPVLLMLVFKEIFQLTAGIVYLRRGQMLAGALPTGKVCTAVLFISLTALVLFPRLPTEAVNALAALDLAVLSISFLCYTLVFFGKDGQSYFQDIKE